MKRWVGGWVERGGWVEGGGCKPEVGYTFQFDCLE